MEMFIVELLDKKKIWIPEGMDMYDMFEYIKFKAPTPPLLDLNKEIQSSIQLISANLSTHEIEAQKYSSIPYTAIFEQAGIERIEMINHGLNPDPGVVKDNPPGGNPPDATGASTPTGETPKPPGSGPGRIPNENSTLS